ncbi:MAG: beta-galactosidase [Pseudomonadota bacterium]
MTTRSLGVCYYPEHWPEERWSGDAARMVASGIRWVRIGEFAWSRIEPRPGQFEWDWLDRAVRTLADADLAIVMGTPTATPPRWLVNRCPDMLAVDADGRLRTFGSRRHYDFSHKGYLAEAVRISSAMAERYGRHPAVGAWQLDNEYGCHDTTLSWSPAAAAGFRQWLRRRYGSIADLNGAWGNVFWSMEYGDFDEVELPHCTVTEPNPAHAMDFRRFAADQVVEFNRALAAAVRPHSSGRPLLHNYMGRIIDFDHFEVGRDLDVATWDSYPLGFLLDRAVASVEHQRHYARQGDPDFQAFHHDLYRTVGRGRLWVMEQQPGPVNWAPYNPDPAPGMVRLWALEAFAHGAEVVSFFRWRQAPFGQEQMHAGLERPDGVAAPALAEVRQVAAELEARPIAGTGASEAAIVFDYESAWAWTVQPQGQALDYFALIFEVYRACRRHGLSIDILPPDVGDVEGYRLVAVPGLTTWRPALIEALARFSGVAIIGPRTGSKTGAMRIPDRLPPDLPPTLLDARVVRVESLRADMAVPLAQGGAFTGWREKVEGDAMVMERTVDGWPAVLAQGRVRYLCGWPDEIAMARLIEDVVRAAGLAPRALPEGVRIRRTADGYAAVNYGLDAMPLGADLTALGLPDSLDGCDVAFSAAG